MARLADLVETRVNPLMLKETYQGVRGATVRMLGGIVLLIPLVSYIVSAMVFEDEDSVEYPGRAFFVVLTSVLSFLGCLFIPLRAAQHLNQEIKTHTLDLIALTQLSPWQLAVGRFQALALQIFLVFAYAMPFATAAIAMGGVSLSDVFVRFVTLGLLSLLQCSAVLAAASTLALSTKLGSLAIAIATLQTFYSGFALVVILSERSRVPDLEVIVWLAVLLVLGIVLCLRLAADALTVSASRTFALSKLCLAVWLAAYFTPLWMGPAWTAFGEAGRIAFIGFGLSVLYAFAILWSAARSRDLRGVPFWRLLIADGHASTLKYCAALTVVITGGALVQRWPAQLPILCFAHFASWTGLAALLHSLPRGERTPEKYFAVLFGVSFMGLLGIALCMPLLSGLGFGLPGQVLVALLPPLALKDLDQLPRYAPALSLTLVIGVGSTVWARRRNARRAVG